MAIPAEQGLVRQYTASFDASEPAGTVKSIYFTQDGTEDTFDYTVNLQDQGVAIFVDNPLDSDITVKLFASMNIYGETFEAKIGEFSVPAGEDAGYAAGFGQLRKGFRVDVSNDSAPSSAGNVVVAVVPSNG